MSSNITLRPGNFLCKISTPSCPPCHHLAHSTSWWNGTYSNYILASVLQQNIGVSWFSSCWLQYPSQIVTFSELTRLSVKLLCVKNQSFHLKGFPGYYTGHIIGQHFPVKCEEFSSVNGLPAQKTGIPSKQYEWMGVEHESWQQSESRGRTVLLKLTPLVITGCPTPRTVSPQIHMLGP